MCLRPSIDTRSEAVRSRAGLSYDGITIPPSDLDTLAKHLAMYEVIGLDEFQFFSADAVPLLHDAMRRGKVILVSGLDTDFRGDVFPAALALLASPETIVQRTRAVCPVCRQHNATRTQRLRNGEPVRRDDPVVAVEGADDDTTYEPRCVEHHVVR